MGLFEFPKSAVKGYNYDTCAEVEGKRLRTQAALMQNMDKPIFQKLLRDHPNATVLDIGCNEGDSAMDRLHGLGASMYIGIDVSKKAIEAANRKYGDDAAHFVQYDVTNKALPVDMYSILKQFGVEQVDVIIISLVLLHLEEPDDLLNALYPFLKRGGVLYIKDIDDRDNKASIDPQGIFEKSLAIADHNRESGNRNVGRKIPGWLKTFGYKDITCHLKGLSSRGMTKEQKQALWDTYFGFFTGDTIAECEHTNGSKQSLYDLGWCTFYLPKMYELFMEPSFEYTLGFCVYTATKAVGNNG